MITLTTEFVLWIHEHFFSQWCAIRTVNSELSPLLYLKFEFQNGEDIYLADLQKGWFSGKNSIQLDIHFGSMYWQK